MKVTLGGDRLGSGKKQKLELSHYNRSSFNLEQDWKSSMAPGILYPCLGVIGTNGDTFDIDVDSFFRTLPTKGPLLGSFKAQVDLFSCPFRLYQGILHNNPVNIGLKMSQVYLPKILIKQGANPENYSRGNDFYSNQIANNALLKYLGLSGIGLPDMTEEVSLSDVIQRKIMAIPVLAYYDIFKNYYANKQEEKAYVISPNGFINGLAGGIINLIVAWLDSDYTDYTEYQESENINLTTYNKIRLEYKNLDPKDLLIEYDGDEYTIEQLKSMSYITTRKGHYDLENEDWLEITIKDEFKVQMQLDTVMTIQIRQKGNNAFVPNRIQLEKFDLENIDKMRNRILKLNELGDELVIDDTETLLPYSTLTKITKLQGTNQYVSNNAYNLNGLVVKTYQSDLFNNWVNTDWIEGENGIAAISSVDVSGGSLSMDALNLAQKVYEMLNRVAVTGGTYEDWQEAVYDETAVRKAESPMYIGGMSAEIMFEEVISTAETKIDDDFQALGSLGGKGTQVSKNGGNNITVHFKEPGMLMAIVSLTPRTCQTQGNEWYLTELDTLNDLHKPGLDGIGFQDLIVEQMAWWDTKISVATPGTVSHRSSAGKVPAWINYTTAIDKAYGDFASAEGKAFMVLGRNYTAKQVEVDQDEYTWLVDDVTTYIDPSKYNYAFAYNDLAAQNFWAQIHFKIIARRKMSAHQIPNL